MGSADSFTNHFLPAVEKETAADSLANQIARHENADAHQSILHTWLSNVWDGGSRNELKELETLQTAADNAKKSGDKDALAAIEVEATRAVMADQQSLQQRDTYLGLASGALQTTVLAISHGKARNLIGITGSAAVGALDTVKSGDSGQEQLVEGFLGAAKGVALNGLYRTIGSKDWNPITQSFSSMGTGMVSRFADYASNADLYKDGIGNGLSIALSQSADLSAIGVDAATGLIAGGIIRTAKSSLGARIDVPNPALLNNMATGSVFGLTAGASSEIVRQNKEHESFDLGKVVQNSLLQGGVNMLPGLAGYRRIVSSHETSSTNAETRLIAKSLEIPEALPKPENAAPIKQREFMVVGGVEAVNALVQARMSGKSSPGATLTVREILGGNADSLDHPAKMFVQHIEDPKSVVTQNLIGCGRILAICHGEALAPEVRETLHVLPDVDGSIRMHLNDAGTHIAFSPGAVSSLDGFARSVPLGFEPTGRQAQSLLYSWLKSPVNPGNRVEQREGISDKKEAFHKLSKEEGWRSAMTEEESGADLAGMDIVFVNSGNRKIVPVDLTKNGKGRSYSEFRNSTIFQAFFDRPVLSGSASANMPQLGIMRGVQIASETKIRLLDHLTDAFAAPSILSTSDTLVPSIKRAPDPMTVTDLTGFSQRLKAKQGTLIDGARLMDSQDPANAKKLRTEAALIRDYLDDMQSPLKFVERRVRAAADPERPQREAIFQATVKEELRKVLKDEKLTGVPKRGAGAIHHNALHDEITVDARDQVFKIESVSDMVRSALRFKNMDASRGSVETAVGKLMERLDRLGPQRMFGPRVLENP